MEMLPAAVLFGAIAFFLAIGVPIAFGVGLATLLSLLLSLPAMPALTVSAQRIAAGTDSFTLLAIPCFILAGLIMNNGGIARRLIEFAKVLVGRLPGSLAQINVFANMLFGSISGSAVAAAAAVGGVMTPMQERERYDRTFSAAVNITSCPSGLLIPPSGALILFSLVSGGTSIAALFLAGYLPGLLMGMGVMIVAGVLAWRRGYPVSAPIGLGEGLAKTLDALPSLALIFIVMGGIVAGIFTATEASAIAVVYTLLLAMVVYREVRPADLPRLLLETATTTGIIMLLVGTSTAMAWVMANAGLPQALSAALLSVSDNPFVILLMINVTLLIVGTFMDLTPAILIFTPIFLPVAQQLGMDPVHFGIMLVFNLCIGICTPPVGSALFVGCSVARIEVHSVVRPLLPFYAVLIAVLLLVTYVPAISLVLPRLFGY